VTPDVRGAVRGYYEEFPTGYAVSRMLPVCRVMRVSF